MKKYEIREKFLLGGKGSGNWGHAGRPGKRGGSMPRSVAMSIRTGRDWEKRQKAVKGSKFGSSPVTGSYQAGRGINDAVILEFEDGTKGIFKEADMAYGSAEGEVLAYELSESLGWDLVPETLMYQHEGKEGSLQKWVDDAEVAGSYRGSEVQVNSMDGGASSSPNPNIQLGIDRMDMLDSLLENGDRHFGNWLIGKDKIVAIDNGGAFGVMDGGIARADPYNYRPTIGQEPIVISEVRGWINSPASDPFVSRVADLMGPIYAGRFENAARGRLL